MISIVNVVVFLVLAPVVGGLIMGLDRKITARMQGRVGPPVLQPFYDIGKLFEKERTVVHSSQMFFVLCYLVFIIISGALFFGGGDLLLVIFALTLAHVFLVLGAYASFSPYSYVGAERELLMIMAYEPMVILTAVGFYMLTNSFYVADIATAAPVLIGGTAVPAVVWLIGIFIGFLTILTLKLRKSPFDISTSHHAHQEIVKGLTTEFSGPVLAQIEIAHLYETVFLMGMVFLFFAGSWTAFPFNIIIAVAAIIIVYFLEILVDNTFSRVKWQFALKSAWAAAAVLGILNLVVLYLTRGV
jgi:formate hydrogenlyase subunit 4